MAGMNPRFANLTPSSLTVQHMQDQKPPSRVYKPIGRHVCQMECIEHTEITRIVSAERT